MATTDRVNTEAIASMIEGGRHLVPGYMWDAVEGYFVYGRQPGNFLTALLSNDLMEVFARADDVNTANMREWCQFLYNYAPWNSYGSPAAVREWLAQFEAENAA